jgi:hypothetical protein
MRRGILLALLAGCDFNPLSVTSDSGTEDAVEIDAPPVVIDAPPGATCVGAGAFEVCIAPEVRVIDQTLSGTFNTDTGPCANPSDVGFTTSGLHPEACFVIGASITVNGLEVRGTRGLVLASTGAITITGTVDSSAGDDVPGAGARTACDFGSEPGDTAGGAGGTYREVGGNGGNGSNNDENGGTPGELEAAPSAFRGGCPGQNGQGGNGDPGLGGGAFYAGATTSLTISGATIDVSGSGGKGGAQRSGGGGGGSGGLVYLYGGDSTTSAGAIVVANGGGGGGAGISDESGESGSDPDPTDPTRAPAGGDSPGGGGNGGPGFPGPNRTAQNSSGSNQGGGGGGGGAGHIVTNRALTDAIASPTP